MSDPQVWQGRRPRTLIDPASVQDDARLLRPSDTDWFQANSKQLLELRPKGWGTVNVQGAMKVARGETVEEDRVSLAARYLTGRKMKGIS